MDLEARDTRGSVFLLWGVAEIFFGGVGRGEAGAKSSGQGGATVKLGAFSGQGGAVLKIFGARGVQVRYFSCCQGGVGRGLHPCS